jgi:hypothetical protein
MPCNQYKDALVEAATAGGALSAALRSHVDGCASCRTCLERERALFAAIDADLRRTANEPISDSLLLRVRSRLAEEAAPKRSWQAWASAAAAAIIVTLVLTQGMSRREGKQAAKDGAGPEKAADFLAESRPASPTSSAALAKQFPRSTPLANLRPRRQHTKPGDPTAVPEVLVAPEEERALVRYVASLERYRGVLQLDAEKGPGPLEIVPIVIAELELEPIEGANRNEHQRN